MKRIPLRRKSKSPYRKAVDAADAALQSYYRAKYPNAKCESCNRKADLRHHFIPKSRSAFLRYSENNLIPLCVRCHILHHQFGDARVHARIVLKRGAEWLKELLKESRKHLSLTVKLCKEIEQKYKAEI